jgi:SRSO17 transposase
MQELRHFHAGFHACFTRREPREHFWRYMVGQFSTLERKSIEPLALPGNGGNARAMQRFLREAVWDEEQMRWNYHHLVRDDLGDPEGVVIFDESGFPKKGKDSVGVARQYCGTLGKVENGQVGVFAAYASCHGYALLDKRVFLPEAWFTDAYTRRRTLGRVPPELSFQTKPQLAAQMLHTLHEERVLPFKYVVADRLYGQSPEFLAALERYVDLVYLVAISADTRCWLQGPVLETTQDRYKGEVRSQRQVRAKDSAPPAVEAIARRIPAWCWYQRTVSEGPQGPISYEFTKRRVTLCRDGLPERTVWLVIKRRLGEQPAYWYYVSNAPLRSRLPLFGWLSGVRWAIEQCFEAAQTELGMDQYEMRQYPGWHHHMLTCLLAHVFLWQLKIRLGEKSPSAYRVAAPGRARSGTTSTHIYDRGGPGADRLGTTAESPRVSVAPKATGGRGLNKVTL